MSDEALDLSSIDLDPERRERLVASIMARVEPELVRRRSMRGVLGLVATWRVPVIAASMLITALSVGALLVAKRASAETASAVAVDLYDALELDQPVRRWLAEGRGPTTVDLVTVLEEAAP